MARAYQDHYAVLGVPRDASTDEIKRAYRKLMRALHPDSNPGEEERAKAVTWAYAVLNDPEQRERFDAEAETWLSGDSFVDPSTPHLEFEPPVLDFGEVEIDGDYVTISVKVRNRGAELADESRPRMNKEYGLFWTLIAVNGWETDDDSGLFEITFETELTPEVTVGAVEDLFTFTLDEQVIGELPIRAKVVRAPASYDASTDGYVFDVDDSPSSPRTLGLSSILGTWLPSRHGRLVGSAVALSAVAVISGTAYILWPEPHPSPASLYSSPGFTPNTIQKHQQDVTDIAVDSKGDIASVGWDGTVYVSEPNGSDQITINPVPSASGQEVATTSVSYSNDGKYLAVGYSNGVVGVYDPSNSQDDVAGAATLSGKVDDVAFSSASNDEVLAVATQDRTGGSLAIMRISASTGPQMLATLPLGGAVLSLAYDHSDGGLIAAVVDHGKSGREVQVWDTSKHVRIASIPDNTALSVSFSADDRNLAIADAGAVKIWNVWARQVLDTVQHLPVKPDIESPHVVAFSATRPSIVAFVTTVKERPPGDDTVELYDISTHQQLAVLSVGMYVYALAFDPRGTLLSTGGGPGLSRPGFGDNSVHVWSLSSIGD